MTDLLDLHGRALAEFDRRVDLVGDDQWNAATPCTDWTVRDLVGHLVGEQLWVPDLLAGATIEQVGDRYDGDQLGDDPKRAWRDSSRAARTAWLEPGAVNRQVWLSYGPDTAKSYLWQMTSDLAVHAWDLARGISADDDLDPELCQALYDHVQPDIESWRTGGLFAEAVPVAADADIQTRLLGIMGRRR